MVTRSNAVARQAGLNSPGDLASLRPQARRCALTSDYHGVMPTWPDARDPMTQLAKP